jgi:ribosomal protein S6
MQTYELTYIITPEVSSVEAEAKAKELESAIQKQEGVIVKQLNPTAKTLSFQIQKHASGFFGVIEFQLEQEKLAEIKSFVEKDKKFVRHMILVKKPVRIRKQRRSKKTEELPTIEAKSATPEKVEENVQPEEEKVESKPKVELKDIEQQLDAILGE